MLYQTLYKIANLGNFNLVNQILPGVDLYLVYEPDMKFIKTPKKNWKQDNTFRIRDQAESSERGLENGTSQLVLRLRDIQRFAEFNQSSFNTKNALELQKELNNKRFLYVPLGASEALCDKPTRKKNLFSLTRSTT